MREAHPFELPWKDHEKAVIDRLAKEKQMSEFGVLKQALRLYHQHNERLAAGETLSWSGDEARRTEFVGPDFEDT